MTTLQDIQNLMAENRALRDELAARDAALEAKAEAEKLLRKAMDIFDGELSLCDDANTPEWLWKWRVRYYFEDTDIPPHPLPVDMGEAP
jgi:hypothetical protein